LPAGAGRSGEGQRSRARAIESWGTAGASGRKSTFILPRPSIARGEQLSRRLLVFRKLKPCGERPPGSAPGAGFGGLGVGLMVSPGPRTALGTVVAPSDTVVTPS